jgi:hypothetical protein
MQSSQTKYLVQWLWKRKEALIWTVALVFLAVSNPAVHHYTLCPLDNLGFHYCPGCGLGRSIGYFFRLDFISSFYAHPLGIPTVFLLIFRIIRIITKQKFLNLTTT